MNGKGKLTLTGQLGDVMKESATAALTFVRANANEFDIDPEFNENSDIHVHVPAGEISQKMDPLRVLVWSLPWCLY
ncbi:hypothetical protein Ct9H90mP29_01780 [bacterium]|nr:MAG: hypothetical protein Ct9H90mP29_01780 [bacterium]